LSPRRPRRIFGFYVLREAGIETANRIEDEILEALAILAVLHG